MVKGKIDTMQELNEALPDKHEVAKELGIPLDQGHNEELTTSQVGKIGGRIGGQKVKMMIEMAEEQMAENAATEAAEANNHK
ncbi:alpha/beta-type small acid-soluble spore protein [Pelosinus propionicus]|uniref:Small, acid-soluble spore protein, alpha/beta type n=1 Tax=Pelosinus propionicus DSM 13327 TaxID=1123291 RepID=A0A1I4HW95_9FIRM|nr:alpha/beta-type small acid-soluble spore protein [Pelosinus propionicus]SFL46465.1 Small, acid-soluble spore protein, alpha/beta type [Pelosinus propionicus DSM 13327]